MSLEEIRDEREDLDSVENVIFELVQDYYTRIHMMMPTLVSKDGYCKCKCGYTVKVGSLPLPDMHLVMKCPICSEKIRKSGVLPQRIKLELKDATV